MDAGRKTATGKSMVAFFGLYGAFLGHEVSWVLFISKLSIAQWIAFLARSGTVVYALILLLTYLVCLLGANKPRATCKERADCRRYSWKSAFTTRCTWKCPFFTSFQPLNLV